MIAIQQTVDIPAEREIFLKLPETVPVGRATITVSVGETTESGGRPWYTGVYERKLPELEELKRQAAEKTTQRKASGKKLFEGLYGILKDSEIFTGDPVEIVRKWRDEWDDAR